MCSMGSGVEAWRSWVAHLGSHPLDLAEYVELVSARAEVPERLEIAGIESLWAELDAVDGTFVEITIETCGDPLNTGRPDWWWARRLPAAEDDRAYLARDVDVSRFASVEDVEQALRAEFGLGTDATARLLRHHGLIDLSETTATESST